MQQKPENIGWDRMVQAANDRNTQTGDESKMPISRQLLDERMERCLRAADKGTKQRGR
ncbi:MAG TPA: hypothetical protein VHK69_18245 [Chitinophagaceae bacterium]|nr:hypothetical protein [Chitinophagaceae bacterium]